MLLQNELYVNYLQRAIDSAVKFASTRVSLKDTEDFEISIHLSKREAEFLGAEEGNLNIKGRPAKVFIKEEGEYSHINFREGKRVAVYYCEPIKKIELT